MACPFFDPQEPHTQHSSDAAAMLPLGGEWLGLCRANPNDAVTPDPAAGRLLCNLGYARRTCPRFPATEAVPDAARFTIRGDDGDRIGLYYVLERGHHPFAHGPLAWSRESGEFTGEVPAAPVTAVLLRQARAYVASYLSTKDEPAGH